MRPSAGDRRRRLLVLGSMVFGRMIRTALVLAGILLLVFVVVRAVPGDPALSILGEQAPADELARLRHEMGLDRSLLEQFGAYAAQVADGSLGRPWSRRNAGLTVSELVFEAMPFTFELALAAVLVAVLIALPLGVMCAMRRNRPVDHAALAVTLVGVAMPGFWIGPLLIHAFCVRLHLLPDPASGVQGVESLLLPAFVLGLALSAKLTRMVRTSVLDVMEQPYVLAARARGIPESRVIVRHVLRNALIPVVTVLGLQFAALLSGAIVTEKVFARPGLGTLLLEGIAVRDYAIVQGTTLIIGFVYVAVNLVVDLLYLAIDPRLARSRTAG